MMYEECDICKCLDCQLNKEKKCCPCEICTGIKESENDPYALFKPKCKPCHIIEKEQNKMGNEKLVPVTLGTPVIEFKDNKELNAYLRWWQDKLQLNDWVIQAELIDNITDEDGTPLGGHIDYIWENNCAFIDIKAHDTLDENCIPMSKFCAELNLVHELLHLYIGWLKAPDTHDGTYYNSSEHKKLEKLAKAFIMAKYNLTFDWFYPDVKGGDNDGLQEEYNK